MGKIIDLTGQKFDKLLVKQFHGISLSNRQATWLCQCACGREVIRNSTCLRNKSITKNCGKPGCGNTYFEENGHLVGLTFKGERYLLDKEDYSKICNLTWIRDLARGYIYARKTHSKTAIYMHHLIIEAPNGCIDHINLDKSDNRKDNLRICTIQQNSFNRGKHKGKRLSIYKGVTQNAKRNKYIAQIRKEGKIYRLGYFETEEEAAFAYNKAAIEMFGEFAKLNDIE
jgi:hypothetical protein